MTCTRPGRIPDGEPRAGPAAATREENAALFGVLRDPDATDEERKAARDEIVLKNQGLLWTVARRMAGPRLRADDLAGEGMIYLYKAVDMFDPARGFTFSTYAARSIEMGVRRAMVSNWAMIRVPQYTVSLRHHPERAGTEGKKRLLRAAATALKWSPPDTLHTVLARPEDRDSAEFGEELRRLAGAMRVLDARDREVVSACYGLGRRGPESLAAIGERLGLTRERARQVRNEALAKLRDALGGQPRARKPRQDKACRVPGCPDPLGGGHRDHNGTVVLRRRRVAGVLACTVCYYRVRRGLRDGLSPEEAVAGARRRAPGVAS